MLARGRWPPCSASRPRWRSPHVRRRVRAGHGLRLGRRGRRARSRSPSCPSCRACPYFEAMNAGGQKAAAALGNVAVALPGPDAGRRRRAGRHRALVHPAEGQHADRGAERPRLDGAAAAGGQGAGHPRGDRRHRRPQLACARRSSTRPPPQGIGEALTDALLKADGRQGQVRDRVLRADGGEPELLDQGPEGVHRDEVPAGADRRHRLRGRGPGQGHPDGDRPDERPPRPHRARRRVHVLGARCGAGGAGRQQDRQGVHRRARHAAVDEAVPGQGLLDRRDPVGRREPRLPDGVDRRPARARTSRSRRPTTSSDALPAIKYDAASKTLLLGPPLAITKDNVDQFNY